jgi:hypothetical protein
MMYVYHEINIYFYLHRKMQVMGLLWRIIISLFYNIV